jgi:hypothetical protein
MIESRFFDKDPLSGATTIYHYDHATDKYHLERTTDYQDIVDMNRRFHNDQTDANWKGEMHMVATLPNEVWFDLKKRGILDDDKAFRRWLNDSENSAFRVKPGRV